VRLFLAAELPADLRRRFEDLQRELKEAPLPVRWVPVDGIHLTLKFLGEVAGTRLAEVTTAVSGAARHLGPFRLEAVRAVPFPARGTPRLIWVEVQGDIARARNLASAIDAATARLSFPPETREFRPHLTLGRVNGPGQDGWRDFLERSGRLDLGEFEVMEYVLFESRLDPRGAVYTPLRRFPLGGERAAGGAP
jgi:RNA 2',3'-cyclic 3'-phosphodiesterase